MTSNSEKVLEIRNSKQKLSVERSDISGSYFHDANLEKLVFENICLAGTKIVDANLSDIEINGAQIGGAYIHNIGMPTNGHPYHDPKNMEQRPVRFDNCDLYNSTVSNSDLTNVEIINCKVTGMKINGILVDDLLKAYKEQK